MNQEVFYRKLLNESSSLSQDEMDHMLYEAASSGYKHIVRLLIKAGADIEYQIGNKDGRIGTPLTIAAENGHVEVVQVLRESHASLHSESSNHNTALMLASLNGHLEIVQKLVLSEYTTQDNENIHMALKRASEGGHKDIVDYLIAIGAEINWTGDFPGTTALMFACRQGHGEIVRTLLELGASTRLSCIAGHFPLLCAVIGNHLDIVNILIENGANLDQSDNCGITALMYACIAGYKQIAATLILNGADTSMTDEEGRTAVMHASLNEHVEIIEMLLDYESDIEKNPEFNNVDYGIDTNESFNNGNQNAKGNIDDIPFEF